MQRAAGLRSDWSATSRWVAGGTVPGAQDPVKPFSLWPVMLTASQACTHALLLPSAVFVVGCV